MQNILNNKIKFILPIFESKLFENEQYNDHYHYKENRLEILTKEVCII